MRTTCVRWSVARRRCVSLRQYGIARSSQALLSWDHDRTPALPRRFPVPRAGIRAPYGGPLHSGRGDAISPHDMLATSTSQIERGAMVQLSRQRAHKTGAKH